MSRRNDILHMLFFQSDQSIVSILSIVLQFTSYLLIRMSSIYICINIKVVFICVKIAITPCIVLSTCYFSVSFEVPLACLYGRWRIDSNHAYSLIFPYSASWRFHLKSILVLLAPVPNSKYLHPLYICKPHINSSFHANEDLHMGFAFTCDC